MNYQKKIILKFIQIFDFNLWFEKIIYINIKINKLGLLGKIFSIIFGVFIRIIFNCDISPNITIGKNVKFPHAVGIVIGSTAVIGDNSVIMPNVVIGSKHYPPSNEKRHATIGKNCLIGANATILGDIFIDDNCIIAAGARVTKNLEANSKFIQLRGGKNP